jgi:hypothetical protein
MPEEIIREQIKDCSSKRREETERKRRSKKHSKRWHEKKEREHLGSQQERKRQREHAAAKAKDLFDELGARNAHLVVEAIRDEAWFDIETALKRLVEDAFERVPVVPRP